MITKSDSFENLACELLSGNPSREAVDTLCNEPSFLAFANKNEISGAIVASIDLTGKSSIVPIAWRDAYNSIQAQVSEYLSETDSIASVLKEQGILLVVLKNGGIARNIYCFAGAVPMGDIDVLVRKCDFRQAHQILLNNGYQFEFRSELEKEDLDEAEQGGGAEYWKLLPNGEKLWFELQWRPVAGRWIRPDQEPSADELMDRSIPIEGTAVRLLAPEDNLLQVCLHTAKHSYVRAPGFRLHLDVERIVRAYPALNWDVFVQRVLKLQVKTATYFSLLIPKELFETPVPDKVLGQLRPPAWKEKAITRMINKAGLFNPHEQKFTRWQYILFNSLLYDDFYGFWRGVFPDKAWMQERYGFEQGWQLPYYHLKRMGSLLFRRLAT